MQQFLKDRAIFFNWQTIALFCGYTGIRIASYFLVSYPTIQSLVVAAIAVFFIGLYIKNPRLAWLMLLTEFFLGGSGNLLAFYDLSLRSILLILFIFLWCIHHIAKPENIHRLHIPHLLFYGVAVILGYIAISAIIGWTQHHQWQYIAADVVPYVFFFFLLPFYHLFDEEKSRAYVMRLLAVSVVSTTFFTLFTFFLFSSGTASIHGEYYGWFRDVVMGKITDMFTGFYRIVAPEHLLMVPLTIILASLLMRQEKHHAFWYILTGCLLLTLVLNFSRTYGLAIIGGFAVLLYKHSWRRWLSVSASCAIVSLALFTGIHVIVSGGTATGWDLIGLRVASLTQPALEDSSYTRAALVDPIVSIIQDFPIFGSGLGSTITFIHPLTRAYVTTNQFDWGYLELLAELGIFGTVLYLSLIASVMYLLIKKIRQLRDHHDLFVGFLGALTGMLIMTITTPALYHVFGIFFLTAATTIVLKDTAIHQTLVGLLYQMFHKRHA